MHKLCSCFRWPNALSQCKNGHLGPLPVSTHLLFCFLSLPFLTKTCFDSRSIQVVWTAVDARPPLQAPQDDAFMTSLRVAAGGQLRFLRAPQLLSSSSRVGRCCRSGWFYRVGQPLGQGFLWRGAPPAGSGPLVRATPSSSAPWLLATGRRGCHFQRPGRGFWTGPRLLDRAAASSKWA